MAIRFRCPQCNREYQVAEEFAGRQAKCKECGAVVTIPSAAPAPAPPGAPSVPAQAPGGRSVPAQAAAEGVYAAAHTPGAPPPFPVKRPASVTVIAILQIIFNSLALVGALFGVLQLAGLQLQTKESQIILEDSLQRTWTFIMLPIATIVAIFWIVVCVGLLRLRQWARSTALALAVVDIVLGVASIVMSIYIFQFGPLAKLAREQPELVRTAMSVGFVVGIFFAVAALAYYVVVLILLTRRKVADAFAAAGRRQSAPGGLGGR
jgi:hypothetical protein